MSASQQCNQGSNAFRNYLLIVALPLCSALAQGAEPAADAAPDCDIEGVVTHVREQFRIYGPRSRQNEYFGFIYRVGGELASAVVSGNRCNGPAGCTIDTTPAARRLPAGAIVLGEWHTHPHALGSNMLSIEDVRGARNNAHIRCYSAYYATSNGRLYSWKPGSTSVPIALATRVELGNYWEASNPAPAAYVAGAAN